MYYKLPIKERIELMKAYKKANPDMSYRDMVNDYNTSYEKFDNGGKIPKSRTDIYTDKALYDKAHRAEMDSLNTYNAFIKSIKGWTPVNESTSQAAKDFIKGNKNIEGTYYHPVDSKYKFEAITYLGKTPKKPVVHNVYQEPIKNDTLQYLPMIKDMPSLNQNMIEPEIQVKKQEPGYRKVSWRYDPYTKLQVPVLLTDPKMKVNEGQRIYNKDVPSTTGAVPQNWQPDFNIPQQFEKTDPYWRSKYLQNKQITKK